MPGIGDKLSGKYRLIDLLGAGGMGEVYSAEHEELGKRVAIKFLHPGAAGDEEGLARFRQEARAAAAIGHPAIIDVYDIGTTEDGQVYLVMEFLQGESLGERLGRERPLPRPLVLHVAAQVLSALHAAHEQNIVHRDVKPDNVFLVRSGQALPGIKLLDFGTARVIDPHSPEDRLTKSGVVIGTPYYMAPEQASGASDVDRRADLYSVGVILYECLTGRLPFEGRTLFDLIRRILEQDVVRPSELAPELPEALEALILKALARDRDQRFASGVEMLRELLPLVGEREASLLSLPDELSRLPATLLVDRSPSPGEDRRPSTPELEAAETLLSRSLDRRWPRRIGVGFLALAALALVAFGVLRDRGTVGVAPEVAPAPSLADADRSEPVEVRASQSVEAPTITVRVEGLPEGAELYVDGVLAQGTTLRLERSSVPRELVVKRGGQAEWQRALEPSRDQRITVELGESAGEPLRAGGDPPVKGSGPRRSKRDAAPADPGVSPPATGKRPDGGGQPFDTQFRL